mgnify:CR=1 FL=1
MSDTADRVKKIVVEHLGVEATRRRITAAAFELHAEVGPSRTTVQAIAARLAEGSEDRGEAQHDTGTAEPAADADAGTRPHDVDDDHGGLDVGQAREALLHEGDARGGA